MCGIAGFWAAQGDAAQWAATIGKMTAAIGHRGPDDSGLWLDASVGLVLGHRRLAIIDLTPAGHQPKASSSQRFQIVFNGEIYNFQDLRVELSQLGAVFTGHSDTEVLLAGFEYWGVEATVKRATGMFALAVWDAHRRELLLIRDRLGEKPLYYGWLPDGTFVFASELKALRQHPEWRQEIDREALALYMRLSYVPAPFSIYKGVNKLSAGHILCLDGSSVRSRVAHSLPYWRLSDRIKSPAHDRADENEVIDQLEDLLKRTVRGQMISDVSLGAFLSGGIDSSLVVALMQTQTTKPVKTYTIGFEDKRYDESHRARSVARILGTEHTEFVVSQSDALSAVPSISSVYDEPFGDSSQLPTYMVARLAKQHVSVALSGDGGDEIFGGYNRYVWLERILRKTTGWSNFRRQATASSLLALSPRTWDGLYRLGSRLLPRDYKQRLPGNKLHKIGHVLQHHDLRSAYLTLVQTGTRDSPVLGVLDTDALMFTLAFGTSLALCPAAQMAYVDAMTYLPDDIMVKVDRACMAVSLESRAPFLSHEIVEFSYGMPQSLKIRDGKGKYILRKILGRHLPLDLIEQPKMGFAVPVGNWLAGGLKPWAADLMSEQTIRAQGFLDVDRTAQLWAGASKTRDTQFTSLWNVLMFQSWLEHQ